MKTERRRYNSTFAAKPYEWRKTEKVRVPGTSRKVSRLKAKSESSAEKKFKREVRERDDYTCQFPGCGYYDKHIDVHHIAKRSQRPDLKLVTSNAVCLCRFHHAWTDTHHDEAVSLGLVSVDSYELAQKETCLVGCDMYPQRHLGPCQMQPIPF